MSRSLSVFASDLWKWSKKAFGDEKACPFIGAARHLVLEAIELLSAAWAFYRAREAFAGVSMVDNPDAYRVASERLGKAREAFADELADCFLLVLDIGRRAGFDAEAIMVFAEAKLKRNKARKWGEGQGVRIPGKPVHHRAEVKRFQFARQNRIMGPPTHPRHTIRLDGKDINGEEVRLTFSANRLPGRGGYGDMGDWESILEIDHMAAIPVDQEDLFEATARTYDAQAAKDLGIHLILFHCMGLDYQAELITEYTYEEKEQTHERR